MKLYINGNATELPHSSEAINIEMVLAKTLPKSQLEQSFALALNGEFVGREDYVKTTVNNRDSIDLLFPIVGG